MAIERVILDALQQGVRAGDETQISLAQEFLIQYYKLVGAGFEDVQLGDVTPEFALTSLRGAELDFHFNPEQSRVVVGDKEEELTPLQNRLLSYFTENPSRIISQQELLQNVWPRGRSATVVERGVNRLRDLIEPEKDLPSLILSVRGHGYMFVDPTSPGSIEAE